MLSCIVIDYIGFLYNPYKLEKRLFDLSARKNILQFFNQ